MKRLLTYLFLVVGLGLVFNVNAYSAFCKIDLNPADYQLHGRKAFVTLTKPHISCDQMGWYSADKISEASAYEYITSILYSKNLTNKNINSNLYITKIALINKINAEYAILRLYGYNYKTLNEVVLKIPQLARYKPFLKSSKKQTHIAKKEPSQTQEVAEEKIKVDLMFCTSDITKYQYSE